MTLRLISFLSAICVLLLDRVSKLWVLRRMSPLEDWTVIPGFLNIIHSQNPGMAFGLFTEGPERVRFAFLICASILAVGLVLIFLWREKNRMQQLALGFILGGAMGNLYERLIRGSVTDFIDLHLGEYHWFTFNVADSAISMGALLIAGELLLNRRAITPNPPAQVS